MNVSIGILAHDEAALISKTLQSLFEQSLVRDIVSDRNIEVMVVANGCTDNTVELARNSLEKLSGETVNPGVRWQIYDVEQSGKTNAWNLFVHEFSDRNAKYLFLMDADIEFLKPDTLRNMLDTLERHTEAFLAIDKPIKNVILKKHQNALEKLSASVSDKPKGTPLKICGQLYCARVSKLREIWMPNGLPVEDGFLRTMILTDRFTSPEDFKRIVLAEGASHVFEAYTDWNLLLRHARWLAMANTINYFLYAFLRANCDAESDAGTLIKCKNEQNPSWLNDLLSEAKQKNGWWLIPKNLFFRRFRDLQFYPLPKRILRLPVVTAAFLVDLLVFIQANVELRRGGGMTYWGKRKITS